MVLGKPMELMSFLRQVRASMRVLCITLTCALPATAGPAVPPSPLPITGTVVNVSSIQQLRNAVSGLASNTTILIAPGTYQLTSPLYVNGSFTNVAIRGASGNRDDVVLVGRGMTVDGGVPFGIWTGGNVRGVTIASLTIRDVYSHPIILNGGTQSPLIHNVRLVNAGQQFIKANPDGAGGGADNGIVEYSVMEYSTTSRDYYTNGVDVHTGDNWIIRHNLFRNIRAPQGELAGPAILMWNASTGTVVDGNTFIDCQREIALGLIERTPNDHSGGIVRNNFIYRASTVAGDSAIYVADSPGTQVLHNSILVSGTYANPIEYRFAHTVGVVIANNVLDGRIAARDGATGSVTGNYTSSSAALFVNPAAGDLHLKPGAQALLDKIATPLANAGRDWDGHDRPAGSATDIGADEYAGSSSTPPNPPVNLHIKAAPG